MLINRLNLLMIHRSLKNHGADDLVNAMFDMGAETMALPMEEKMKFEQGDEGRSFGYVYSRSLPMFSNVISTGTKQLERTRRTKREH